MKIAIRLGCAFALVVTGWLAGRAQGMPEPHFVLDIVAPQGATTVVCTSGCELIGGRDYGNPLAGPMYRYEYRCQPGGNPDFPCKARVYGWLKR
jgi:hypothetical protein